MSELLRILAAYVPTSVAKATLDSRTPSLPTAPIVKRHLAAVLYTDISGFTPLTEALSQKGAEGPEELTRLLNRYLGWMIAFIEAEGGEVIKFGGDSVTAVFLAADEPLSFATRHAVQAAKTMQASMDEFGIMESSVGLINLKMKFGIGAGELILTQVGGVSDRWEYIIAGEALFEATRAERQAKQGEIIVGSLAEAIVAPYLLPPRLSTPPDFNTVRNPAAAKAVLRCYVPRPVLAWLDKDLHGWLATLRPMSVLFVGLGNLNYDEADTIERLHSFVQAVQALIYQYQGSMPRLAVDDKGTVLLILFGAPPYSHEDDSERAVRCALQLQTLARDQNFGVSVGVTTGRVFVGPVGGLNRREYTVMGDTVNLAARLMAATEPGKITCNYETYRTTYGQLAFERLRPLKVKGKAETVLVYRPVASLPPQQQLEHLEQTKLPLLVGRQAEINQLNHCLKAIEANQSQAVIIEGEAGIGKTQVVRELVQRMQASGFTILLGNGRSIEQETPYRPWRDILTARLETKGQGQLIEKIRTTIEKTTPHLVDDISLLEQMLQTIPNNDQPVDILDSPDRQKRLIALLLALLRQSQDKHPLALIFENAQWLDSQSWNLIVLMVKHIIERQIPMMLLVVMRPFERNRTWLKAGVLANVPKVAYLRIDSLPPDEILTLVAAPIGLTSNELPEAVAELLRSRAEGNPFFAEEIFYNLHQNGFITFREMQDKTRCLVSDDFERTAQTLPATIQNIVLSRIDQLPPEKQLLLKVAAVIGRVFTHAALQDTLREHLEVSEQNLKDYLEDLIYLGLIRLEQVEPELTYSFKHVIIQEVTYQTLLFDRRRKLHRTVAKWYEQTYSAVAKKALVGHKTSVNQQLYGTRSLPPSSTPLAPYYSLLVYHWHQAEDELKEQHYAALVGKQAVAQYANAEAIGYLSRALDLTPRERITERYELLLARETIFHRRGDRERQKIDLQSLSDLVQQLNSLQAKAEVALRLGTYAQVTADYNAAAKAARSAIELAKQGRYPDIICKGYLIWIKVLTDQGHYQDAHYLLERIRTMAGFNILDSTEAKILQTHALLHCTEGNFAEALALGQQSQANSQNYDNSTFEAHNLNLIGQAHLNLGDYPSAESHFDRATALFYFVGNKQGEATPLHNIGRLCLYRGDYLAARDYFEYVIDITKDIDDQVAMVDSLIDLSQVYNHWGDFMIAQSYLGQALATCKKIGYLAGEARALSRLGRIYFDQENYETTKRYCQLALSTQESIGALADEYYTQTYLGHALAGLNELAPAITAYERALQLRHLTGLHPPAILAKIGLAVVYLCQDAPNKAQPVADECFDWLETHGPVGLEHPFWAYLNLGKILRDAAPQHASNTARGQKLLDQAHNLLQAQAARIKHKKLRRKFLERIGVNREIVALKKDTTPVRPAAAKRKSKTKEKFHS